MIKNEIDTNNICEFLVHEFNHSKECGVFHRYIINKIKNIYKNNPDVELDPKYILNTDETGMENFFIKKYYDNYKVDLSKVNYDMSINNPRSIYYNPFLPLIYWLFIDT